MRSLRKLLLSVVVLGVTSMLAGAATWSAFSSVTNNPANSLAAGTVRLTDNDSDNTLVTLTNAIPGQTATGCTNVTYGGSLPAEVRLYGTVSGALADYLTLKVTRGTNSGAYPSCNFTADTRDHIGQGNGVIYNGTLSSFPTAVTLALLDKEATSGGTETWTNGEVHAYKLEVTLQNNSLAQGKSATASFTWEARNR